jgi:hypothetical protein
MLSPVEMDVIHFPSILYCVNCQTLVKITEVRAKLAYEHPRTVVAHVRCPYCKIADIWFESESEFMEKFEDYFTKKEAMTKSNPIDYLENSGIRVTPCCNRAIACVNRGNPPDNETFGDGTGTVRCIECDKLYTVTIEDFLITSITPTQDAIA